MIQMNRKKLIYSILKKIENGQEPKKEDYDLNLEQWGEIALLIKNEGLAKGIGVLYTDDAVYNVSLSSARITMAGLEFLEQNSGFAKAYSAVKEVRDWIKF